MRPADPVRALLVAFAPLLVAVPAARAADYALPASRVGASGSASASASYAIAPSLFGGVMAPAASTAYGLAPGFAAQTGFPEAFLAAAGAPSLTLAAQGLGAAGTPAAITLRVYGAQPDLTLTAPAGYELSLSPDSGFATVLVLSAAATTPPGPTIYLRLAPGLPVGAIGGVITVAGTGVSAPAFAVSAIVTGPVATADSVAKTTNGAQLKIPVATLLANDYRVTSTGAVTTGDLVITAVTSGAGNSATLSAGRVLFTGNPAATTETFTYTLADGVSTAIGTVTVALAAPAPFTLQLTAVGTAVFDGDNTSATYAFIGVPGQLYSLQYTSDLTGAWIDLPPTSTGSTGSFAVTVTAPGDQAALWNSRIFFRAVRQP